jgi:hypothetical protein
MVGDSIVEEKTKIADLDAPGEEVMVAKGGLGGEGNHKRKTKQLRSRGMIGETIDYELRLKLIADIGFIGFPNAGKSTLLTAVSLIISDLLKADQSLPKDRALPLHNFEAAHRSREVRRRLFNYSS